MLLANDIVLSPFKGLLLIFREIHKAALDDIAGEAQAIRTKLAALYQMLEQGVIGDDDFDDRERLLLDRLDVLDDRDGEIEMGEEDDDDEDFDDDDEADDEADEDDESVVDSLSGA